MSKDKITVTVSPLGGGYASVACAGPDGRVVTFDFKDGRPVLYSRAQFRVAQRYPELLEAAQGAVA